MKTGARWRDIPKQLPSAATCWRWLRDWEEEGVWDELWCAFIIQLDQQGLLDWQEWQLRAGQNRGLCVGKTKKGKGTKWMVEADGQGLPLGCAIASESPAEVKLAIPA